MNIIHFLSGWNRYNDDTRMCFDQIWIVPLGVEKDSLIWPLTQVKICVH